MDHANLSSPWKGYERIGFRFLAAYIVLFILTFPLPDDLLPDIDVYLGPLFEPINLWVAENVFTLKAPITIQLLSDSTGLYIHMFMLLFYAAFASAVWGYIDRKRLNYDKIAYWFRVVVSYFLAIQLFAYGFNKIFKWQFFLPEPNTLYSTVGETSSDLLFWSALGTSWGYTVFGGIVECLAASLLLFKRTRLLGALLSAGIMVNIVAINFGFNISVKVLSSLFLLLSVIIIWPHIKRLHNFFILNKATENQTWTPSYHTKNKKRIYYGLKTLLLVLIVADAFFMYVSTGNFNDDNAPRPTLHGAYNVIDFVKNGNQLEPSNQESWKRMFVHRRGYLITQTQDEQMHDYQLHVDTTQKLLQLTNYVDKSTSTLAYFEANDSTLVMQGVFFGDTLQMALRKLDWRNLPAIRSEFGFTIDSY